MRISQKRSPKNSSSVSEPEGLPIDPYLLLFLLIVGSGAVVVYIYYLREKNSDFQKIRRGYCPQCGEKSIVVSDERAGGCGPRLITYTCTHCGYQNIFNIEGGCGL